jgi:hypothetical protein
MKIAPLVLGTPVKSHDGLPATCAETEKFAAIEASRAVEDVADWGMYADTPHQRSKLPPSWKFRKFSGL